MSFSMMTAIADTKVDQIDATGQSGAFEPVYFGK
jgi:hypothetical protein